MERKKMTEQTKEEIRELTKRYWAMWQADKTFGRDDLNVKLERTYKALDRVCEMFGISYEADSVRGGVVKHYGKNMSENVT